MRDETQDKTDRCRMSTKQMEDMTKFKTLVESTGLKKEHIIKTSGVSRNKFYFALKAPAILNDKDIEKLSNVMRTDKEILKTIIDSDTFNATA